MGPNFATPGFKHEAPNRGHRDGGRKDGEEGEASNSRERTELDQRNILSLADAECIPGESRKNMASEEFEGNPSGGGDRGGEKVAPRAKPDRRCSFRGFTRGGDDKNKSGPKSGVDGEVEAEDEPSRKGKNREPVE